MTALRFSRRSVMLRLQNWHCSPRRWKRLAVAEAIGRLAQPSPVNVIAVQDRFSKRAHLVPPPFRVRMGGGRVGGGKRKIEGATAMADRDCEDKAAMFANAWLAFDLSNVEGARDFIDDRLWFSRVIDPRNADQIEV